MVEGVKLGENRQKNGEKDSGKKLLEWIKKTIHDDLLNNSSLDSKFSR